MSGGRNARQFCILCSFAVAVEIGEHDGRIGVWNLSEEAMVVISTSGRSHASTVRPVDFVSLSVPPEGKSMRCVLLTCAASSKHPAPNADTANVRIVIRNLFMAITRLVYAARIFYGRQMMQTTGVHGCAEMLLRQSREGGLRDAARAAQE